MHCARRLSRAVAIALAALAGCDAATPPADPVTDVSASAHTCAVTARGAVWCWGLNTYGAVGDGTDTSRLAPVRIPELINITMVSAGYRHTCALDGDSAAWCWGANFNGELGDGTTTHRFRPVRVAGGRRFATITTGEAYSCALTAGGELYCWGAWLVSNPAGGSFATSPTRVGTRLYRSVSAGYESACAVESGSSGNAYCWGLNTWGQLGTNDSLSTNTPTRVVSGVPFASVQVGAGFACGSSGSLVYCWGHNDRGQLGIDAATIVRAPSSSSGGFLSLSARGAAHVCGTRLVARQRGDPPASTAACWGWNAFGQLGDGSTAGGFGPRTVSGGLDFVRVAAGLHHTCGITRDQQLYCWGLGESGQLGTGGTAQATVPTRVELR